MANFEATAGAEARRRIKEADGQIVEAQSAIVKWQAVLEALGQSTGKGKAKGRVRTAGPKKAKRDLTAAHDAMAVKRGTATPEQYQRYAQRMAAKEVGTGTDKTNGPIATARAKHAAAGTAGAPAANLQPDEEVEA